MTFFIILGNLTFFVLSIILNGYVFSILWKWFIVNVFNLPILTIVQAIGVSFTVRFLTLHTFKEEEEINSFSKQMAAAIVKAIAYPILILLFGYIIHLFM